MDSDRILVCTYNNLLPFPCQAALYIIVSSYIQVLNAGQVVEFDSPYALMQRSGTLLCKMVEQTGPFASRKLHQMAVKAHMTRSGPRFEAGYQDFTLETPV